MSFNVVPKSQRFKTIRAYVEPILPKKSWIENRITEIREGMKRYIANGQPIPKVWLDELEEHAKYLTKLEDVNGN